MKKEVWRLVAKIKETRQQVMVMYKKPLLLCSKNVTSLYDVMTTVKAGCDLNMKHIPKALVVNSWSPTGGITLEEGRNLEC